MTKAVLWLKRKFGPAESGQSLVETALLIPVVLLITFNAVNFGYYFFVAIQITAAPHIGAEYSIQGFETPTAPILPTATPPASGPDLSVSTLTYADMAGLHNSANAAMQICTLANGVGATPGTTSCTVVNPGGGTVTFPTLPADPEPTVFSLQRVTVQYTVTPLIPAGVFGLSLIPSLTFTRQVTMRAMN